MISISLPSGPSAARCLVSGRGRERHDDHDDRRVTGPSGRGATARGRHALRLRSAPPPLRIVTGGTKPSTKDAATTNTGNRIRGWGTIAAYGVVAAEQACFPVCVDAGGVSKHMLAFFSRDGTRAKSLRASSSASNHCSYTGYQTKSAIPTERVVQGQ